MKNRPALYSILAALLLTATPAAFSATTVSGDITTDTTWDTAGSPYLVQSAVTVRNGATLTIDPGVIVKVGSGQWIYVGTFSEPGALIADGDVGPGAPAQIVFTSARDDANGGDTNGDGGATTPAAGDWWYVYFQGMASPTSNLRNVSLRYAGVNSTATVVLDHDDGEITLDNVSIRDSAGRGIELAGGTTDQAFVLSNSSISATASESIRLANTATVHGTVSNCALESLVYLGSVTGTVTWTGNTFTNWGEVLSVADPDDVGNLTGANGFSGTSPQLRVRGGTLERDATWTTAAGPLVLLGAVTVQGTDGGDALTTLTLDPGAIVKFAVGGWMYVGSFGEPGALVADGDVGPGAPSQIVFTSARDDASGGDTNGDGSATTPAAGDWWYVYFQPKASPTSSMRNVSLRYAGVNSTAPVTLDHDDGEITLDNLTIRDSAGRGIELAGGTTDQAFVLTNSSISATASESIRLANSPSVHGTVSNCTLESLVYGGSVTGTVTWTGNTFTHWGDVISVADPDDVGNLLGANSFSGASPQLRVLGGTMERDATWSTSAGPFVLLGTVTVQGTDGGDGVTTLTLDPGAIVKFAVGGWMYVGSFSEPGALVADGDVGPGAPSQIVFTSARDDAIGGDTNGDGGATSPAAGDWWYVYFQPKASPISSMRNASLRYGGSSSSAPVTLDHDDGEITLDNLTIRDSAGRGIELVGGSTDQGFVLTNSSISATAAESIRLAGSPTVHGTVSNCALESLVYLGSSTGTVTWTGNTFQNWGAFTSVAVPNVVGTITGNNTLNPVGGAVLSVRGGTVAVDSTWNSDAGPLVLLGTVGVQGTDGMDGITTLRVEDGVEIRFPSSVYFTVGAGSGDPGALVLDGRTPGGFNTINLTSALANPMAGSWWGVLVQATGTAEIYETQMRYVDIGVTVVNNGRLVSVDGLTVNRANQGMNFSALSVVPGAGSPLRRLVFKQCDVGLSSATDTTIRDSNLIGTTYGVRNTNPATACIDSAMNWWGDASGPSGVAPVQGCEVDTALGSGSPITDGVIFDDFLSEVADDGDSVAPGEDNCPLVANESQSDGDGDGVGDACDGNPVFRVSTDPDDLPDFSNTQDAVDAAPESGTTVLIFPGENPSYFGGVRVDRDQVFNFLGTQGVAPGSTGPVILDGLGGPAIRVINTEPLATAPTVLSDLTLRGGQGINAATSTRVRDVIFDQVTGEALDLTGGNHDVQRIEVHPGVAVGARVDPGATLDLSLASMKQLTNAGIVADGATTLTNVLIGGGNGADGVRVGSGSSLTARYVTIVGNTGVGIDNTGGGTVDVERSVLYANAGDDLFNVPCSAVNWSDSGVPDCSSVNDNLSADPLVDLNYRLTTGSPCLDHGPDPSTFTGDPPTDLDLDVRLRDHDGSGLAENDCGAYESGNIAITPGEVANLRWASSFKDTLLWDTEPSAVEYHAYRQTVVSLSLSHFADCADGLDVDRTDTELFDDELPPAGVVYTYLISAEDAMGNEGTLGLSTVAERSNFAACP